MVIQTDTGQVFDNADDAVRFIRECERVMFDPGASMVETSRATTDMVYTFRALDEYLRAGGTLPRSWGTAKSPFPQPGPAHDVLDMS